MAYWNTQLPQHEAPGLTRLQSDDDVSWSHFSASPYNDPLTRATMEDSWPQLRSRRESSVPACLGHPRVCMVYACAYMYVMCGCAHSGRPEEVRSLLSVSTVGNGGSLERTCNSDLASAMSRTPAPQPTKVPKSAEAHDGGKRHQGERDGRWEDEPTAESSSSQSLYLTLLTLLQTS